MSSTTDQISARAAVALARAMAKPSPDRLVDQADQLASDGEAFLRGLRTANARNSLINAANDAVSMARAMALCKHRFGRDNDALIVRQMDRYAEAMTAAKDEHRVCEFSQWIQRGNDRIGYSIVARDRDAINAAWAFLVGESADDFAVGLDDDRRGMDDDDDSPFGADDDT